MLNNDISPFNNIGDIVSAMFESGQVYAIDVSNCDPDIVIKELWSNNPISLVVQDIGKEGHEDYSDLSGAIDYQKSIANTVNNMADYSSPEMIKFERYTNLTDIWWEERIYSLSFLCLSIKVNT